MCNQYPRTLPLRFGLIHLILGLVLAACEMPLTAPTATPISKVVTTAELPESTPLQPAAPTPETTVQIFLPDIERPPQGTASPEIGSTPVDSQTTQPAQPDSFGRLAFLKNGDLWLAELPGVRLLQLTSSADLLTFAWSPDGSRIATFNGRSLCFVDAAGAPANECIGLGLNDQQAPIPRAITWSPDQDTIVLWNLANPWDDEAIGWLVVPLLSPEDIQRIADPVDWGLSVSPNNEPGGITGQPVFLSDGTLVGTLSHRWLCGSGGCHYQLYSFDPERRSFFPYPNNPEEGWSEGQNLVLSPDRSQIANYGTFFSDCESFITFVDRFELSSGIRKAFNLELEALTSLDLSPDGRRAVIARVSGCVSPPEQTTWDRSCGLSQGFDVFPMQIWDLETGERSDSLPGVSPDWSPGGDWIVFRSCLAEGASGSYEPSSSGPPAIYVIDLTTGDLIQVGEGLSPTWSPT